MRFFQCYSEELLLHLMETFRAQICHENENVFLLVNRSCPKWKWKDYVLYIIDSIIFWFISFFGLFFQMKTSL